MYIYYLVIFDIVVAVTFQSVIRLKYMNIYIFFKFIFDISTSKPFKITLKN